MIKIFQYLYDTKGKPIPFEYKLLYKLPLTEDELIINGELWLAQNKITSLPDNLTVNGWVELYKSKIKVLPDNLTVHGNLDISFTSISELPDDLYVGGNLWCRNTPLAERIKNDKSLYNKYKQQVKGEIWHGI